MIGGGSSTRDPRRDVAVSSPAWRAVREADFGEAQEDEAEDGPEYSWDLRPELARNWSAASQRRFSSVAVGGVLFGWGDPLHGRRLIE